MLHWLCLGRLLTPADKPSVLVRPHDCFACLNAAQQHYLYSKLLLLSLVASSCMTCQAAVLPVPAAIMWIVKTATHGYVSGAHCLLHCPDARNRPELGQYRHFLCDHNMPGRCCLCTHHPFWTLQVRLHFLWGQAYQIMDRNPRPCDEHTSNMSFLLYELKNLADIKLIILLHYLPESYLQPELRKRTRSLRNTWQRRSATESSLRRRIAFELTALTSRHVYRTAQDADSLTAALYDAT